MHVGVRRMLAGHGRALRPLTAQCRHLLRVFGWRLLHTVHGEGARAPLYDVCGSKSYVAPEVLQNKGYSSGAVDVWSSGVILYILL